MNQKKQIRGPLIFAACLCAAFWLTFRTEAAVQTGGWQQTGMHRSYCYDDQSLAVGEATIDGIDYLFAPNGVQQTGWQTVRNTRRYYDPSTGEPVTGWLNWRGEAYYIDPESGKQSGTFRSDGETYLADGYGVLQKDTWCEMDGALYHGDADGRAASGEQFIDGSPYLFTADCMLLTGWQTASDGITRRYEPNPDGTASVRTGWLELDGSKYYADAARGMLCGKQEIDGQIYLFSDEGIMQTGFCQYNGKTIYLAPDGVLQTGWLVLEDRTCYLDANGTVQTGFQRIGGALYDFDEDGVMLTGWQTENDHRYYLGEDGRALLGLQEIGENTYFFDENGIMQTGSVSADGIACYFDESGRRIDGFFSTDAGKSYISPLTGETVTGWQTIGTEQYYFDANGIAVTGIVTIGGQNYRFTDDGVCHPVKICLDAGHYGKYNRSPVNPVYYESDFSWKLHLYLKEELEKYNITVITTRPDQNTDLPLEERGKTSAGCDLFLSLHSNASSNAYDDGPLACCTITGTCDQLGLDLANLIADVMGTRQRGSIWKRRGDKFPDLDYYGVLRGATFVNTPSILLEHSFHTNLRTTNWLLDPANLRKLAAAEAAFLAKYYGMIPRRQ